MINILRLALIALAVWLVIFAFRRLSKPSSSASQTTQPPKNMVRCAHCGIHVLQHEAISHQGQHYCCEEHRAKHS